MEQSEPSDKDLEQLLEIAKSKTTVDDSERIDEIGEFILANQVTPSTNEWADGQSVYWVYRKWCIANDIKPKDRVPFHKIFRNRFNQKMLWTGMIGYQVKKEQFELTQEEWFLMRKQFRNEKIKKAKKRRKVSRTES